jgi:hypothetical protein
LDYSSPSIVVVDKEPIRLGGSGGCGGDIVNCSCCCCFDAIQGGITTFPIRTANDDVDTEEEKV